MKKILLPLVALLSLSAAPVTQALDPLFQSDDILELTLTGPIVQLNKERDKDVRYDPATISYIDDDGVEMSLPVKLEPRGNRRLSKSTCHFAPMRLVFKKSEVKGSLFHKQKKLKLVNQCHPNSKSYEQYIATEYISYKILNLLTPNSFNVRLAKIRFEDENKGFMHESLSFFIEHNKRIAKRIDLGQLEIDSTNATRLEGKHLNLVSLFQFMIANTDWSATHGGNEECCHNGKLFGEPKSEEYLFIPYDFDMSGLVNPEYASTDASLKLDSIKERRYRGYCRNTKYLEENIALFTAHREAIEQMFEDSEFLSKTAKRKRLAYINKFYKVISDEKRIERKIMGWCHESQLVTKR